eukprot:5137505-Amphidinium_carterae.1
MFQLAGSQPAVVDNVLDVYNHWGIPRSEDKAVHRACRVESLGFWVLGDRALLKAPRLFVTRLCDLLVWVLGQCQVSRKVLQIVAGRC